jgi:hypothetical protein
MFGKKKKDKVNYPQPKESPNKTSRNPTQQP